MRIQTSTHQCYDWSLFLCYRLNEEGQREYVRRPRHKNAYIMEHACILGLEFWSSETLKWSSCSCCGNEKQVIYRVENTSEQGISFFSGKINEVLEKVVPEHCCV